MKKMIGIVLSIAMLISCIIMPVNALAKSKVQIYKDGNHCFAYEVQKDDTIKVLSYRYSTKVDAGTITVKFPTKIKGKTVTTIDTYCLGARKSTKYFGEFVGEENYGIGKIVLPKQLKRIEGYAFCYEGIEKITIPESVEYIGECAFSKCENLKEVKIGKNVKYIGSAAFCFTAYIDDQKNWEKPNYGGGFYLDNYLLEFPIGVEKYKVREGTTLIGDFAADDSGHIINDVTIPKSVKYIAENALDEYGLKKSFIIRGYRGSAAEKHAKKRGATFKALNPAAPRISVKSGKKKFRVSWKKVKTAEGYQIKYTFKGKSKTAETTKIRKTIKNLKKGTYKVKVRAYKIKNEKRIYSPWSKTKKIRIK